MAISTEPVAKKGVKSVQAVSKALYVLEVMAGEGEPRSLTELTPKVGLSSSTLYRLLVTLCRSGFVEHDHDGRYRIGLKAFHIGHCALESTDLVREARPFIERLAGECNETVNLVVLRGRDAIFIDQVESTQMMLRCHVQIGSRIPAHASGGGKALLAELAPAKLEALYRRTPLEMFTVNTIVSPDALVAELTAVSQRGYAIDDEEREIGVRCVAAAIRDHSGAAVAAVTLTGPSGRLSLPRIEASLGPLVQDTARSVFNV